MILALLSLVKKPVAYNFAVNQQLKVTRLKQTALYGKHRCHGKVS